MKKLIIFTIALIAHFQLQAQENTNLEIDYKETYEMTVEAVLANVPKQYRAQSEPFVREELQNGVSFDFKLLSNGKESIYELQPRISNSQGPQFIAQQMQSFLKGKTHKDLVNLVLRKEQALISDQYIIVDSIEDFHWDITREKIDIAGYQCKKATGVYKDTIDVVAYFAPKIAIKDGPNGIFGLPGLILRAEFLSNGTKVIIEAQKVAVKEEEIKLPTLANNKEVSEEEFMKILTDFQNKMKEMYGGGVETDE